MPGFANNIFSGIPEEIPEELFDTLALRGSLKIERIISDGQTSPENFWYDQEQNEWVILLQGEAELEYFDGQRIRLHPGDYILIPAGQKHRVSYTATKTIWLAVHFA
jgi:cupin 2 domain-containing protein